MKYAWIDAQRGAFDLTELCAVLGVSISGYRAWQRDGGLLVLVTHQVAISAVSDTFADAGTGVLMALGEGGRLERIGTLAFGAARD